MYPELGVGEASNLEIPTQKQKHQQTPALLPKNQERVVQQDRNLRAGTAALLPHTVSVAPLPAASRGLDSHWAVSRWHPPFPTGTVSRGGLLKETIKIQSVIKPKMSRIPKKKKNHTKNQGNLNLNEKRQLTPTPR